MSGRAITLVPLSLSVGLIGSLGYALYRRNMLKKPVSTTNKVVVAGFCVSLVAHAILAPDLENYFEKRAKKARLRATKAGQQANRFTRASQVAGGVKQFFVTPLGVGLLVAGTMLTFVPSTALPPEFAKRRGFLDMASLASALFLTYNMYSRKSSANVLKLTK